MTKLIYTAITSLDGYTADQAGRFDWAMPDEEVHAFVNDLERPVETYLYGRRMYETMIFWETADTAGEPPQFIDWAAIWRKADKIVYSRTLSAVSSARTRIAREFDAAAVRRLKAEAHADVSVGGAELAGQALRAGLVDEVRLLVNPVIVGGGRAALPHGLRLTLKLVDERRFRGGVVYLHYATEAGRDADDLPSAAEPRDSP